MHEPIEEAHNSGPLTAIGAVLEKARDHFRGSEDADDFGHVLAVELRNGSKIDFALHGRDLAELIKLESEYRRAVGGANGITQDDD